MTRQVGQHPLFMWTHSESWHDIRNALFTLRITFQIILNYLPILVFAYAFSFCVFMLHSPNKIWNWKFEFFFIGPDDHVTVYKVDWLANHSFHSGYKKKVPSLLWNKDGTTSNPPPRIGYDDHMNTSVALKRSIFNILKFGYTIVTQVSFGH